MASVHRRDRSPYWFASFLGSDGGWKLRSTKVADRNKAEAVALEWERASRKARQGNLVEAQARQVVSDIMGWANVGESLRAPSTVDFLHEWQATKEASKATGTSLRYAGVVESFLTFLGPKAKRPLTAITAREIEGFLVARRREGCAPGTVQVDGKILSTAFNTARRQGLRPDNPCEAVEMPARESMERGVFTPAEVALLVKEASPQWQTLLKLAYYTGARLSECSGLRWQDVDLVAGIVKFAKTKSGKPHTLPMHPDLVAHLECIAGDAGGFIMPDHADNGPSGRHGLSSQFKRLAAKAGVDIQSVQGGGKRQLARRTFHALRHSFTSALANAGVAPELRMKLTGHKSAEVHRGYTHHELETLRSAVAKLPTLAP